MFSVIRLLRCAALGPDPHESKILYLLPGFDERSALLYSDPSAALIQYLTSTTSFDYKQTCQTTANTGGGEKHSKVTAALTDALWDWTHKHSQGCDRDVRSAERITSSSSHLFRLSF